MANGLLKGGVLCWVNLNNKRFTARKKEIVRKCSVFNHRDLGELYYFGQVTGEFDCELFGKK